MKKHRELPKMEAPPMPPVKKPELLTASEMRRLVNDEDMRLRWYLNEIESRAKAGGTLFVVYTLPDNIQNRLKQLGYRIEYDGFDNAYLIDWK